MTKTFLCSTLVFSIFIFLSFPLSYAADEGTVSVESFAVEYKIENGILDTIFLDPDFIELILTMDTTSDGTVEITIPRSLLDSKFDSTDDVFFVLVDGFETDYAVDGHAAIEKYKQGMKNGNPYAVVIMDLTVPGGMGGGEAIKKLLEIDPQAKAIVSSGYSNNPIMANFNKFGFKGVISKPFRLNEVKKTLGLVLKS